TGALACERTRHPPWFASPSRDPWSSPRIGHYGQTKSVWLGATLERGGLESAGGTDSVRAAGARQRRPPPLPRGRDRPAEPQRAERAPEPPTRLCPAAQAPPRRADGEAPVEHRA